MGKEKKSKSEEKLMQGVFMIEQHILFGKLLGRLCYRDNSQSGKETAAFVKSKGEIYLNRDYYLEPKQWMRVIAHCLLHPAFGHFDAEKMPGCILDKEGKIICPPVFDKRLWNLACDIYIEKFLNDMKFGEPIAEGLLPEGISLDDEKKIYAGLIEKGVTGDTQRFGTASLRGMDMQGLEKPLTYDGKSYNYFTGFFSDALIESLSDAVSLSGGHGSIKKKAANPIDYEFSWFLNSFPLLGGVAAYFELVKDPCICQREEISIAAVDVVNGVIYVNQAAGLTNMEIRFVIAHEFLHAGLCHHERCQGRDKYLWNIACDFVINGWLVDMKVGEMPDGVLYDEKYKDWSAESIYDELIKELRKSSRLNTFRGYGQGDIIEGSKSDIDIKGGMSLDEFCKSALSQGLEYHKSMKRGLVPAGLVEEISALAMPAIPWDVQLARWFDEFFLPVEKRYTYARPSRRQGASPDIPRPSYAKFEIDDLSRTFGVVIDTSGSMSAKMIGMALGSIASYATAKDVPFVRVVFCDARTYDAGYLSPEDIAGMVEVKGRGGTRLQPAIDLLERAKDFPKDGTILIITDGMIEDNLKIRNEHAFLLPEGRRLPFKARGKVFRFERVKN